MSSPYFEKTVTPNYSSQLLRLLEYCSSDLITIDHRKGGAENGILF